MCGYKPGTTYHSTTYISAGLHLHLSVTSKCPKLSISVRVMWRILTGFYEMDYLLTAKLKGCGTRVRLRIVPYVSSGIEERAKRERAWKSPHARKGDTRRGERKMRDYRQSPSFWPFSADWFWSVKFVSPSKSIKRIQWDSFPHWAVIALVIGKLRKILQASKRKPRY